jgi:hypothetical protein
VQGLMLSREQSTLDLCHSQESARFTGGQIVSRRRKSGLIVLLGVDPFLAPATSVVRPWKPLEAQLQQCTSAVPRSIDC